MPESICTVKQAAIITGYHPDTIRTLIRGGKVLAEKVGQMWLIDADSLKAYMTIAESLPDGRYGPKSK